MLLLGDAFREVRARGRGVVLAELLHDRALEDFVDMPQRVPRSDRLILEQRVQEIEDLSASNFIYWARANDRTDMEFMNGLRPSTAWTLLQCGFQIRKPLFPHLIVGRHRVCAALLKAGQNLTPNNAFQLARRICVRESAF